MKTDQPDDPQRARVRERLEEIQIRTAKASSWHDEAGRLRGLVNHEGYVPVSTRLATEDLDFLAGARDDLLTFAELGLRLLDLHQPRDAGGITSDAAHPILRCRSCMWRWPCPTFRAMSESFGSTSASTASEPTDLTITPPGPNAALAASAPSVALTNIPSTAPEDAAARAPMPESA
ncbi:hypothetical protein [Nonomuraea sediminis]|uniref:hypothetical protein n=1 Tax=Nonomuraea sediminis TaxID=2835864 RepID=UPI00202A9E50|nr:hypothetical protein [Nonomuraea sediminis]